jgi:hypothetical protein
MLCMVLYFSCGFLTSTAGFNPFRLQHFFSYIVLYQPISNTDTNHHSMGFVHTNNRLLFYFSKDLRLMENDTRTQNLYY